jgi:tetratricopeptide (TPR) repeat protein
MQPGQSFQVALDNSETLFSLLTAINACGYDAGLNASDAVRAEVRKQVQDAIASSEKAQAAAQQVCQFYHDHQQPDAAHDLAQYVSLGLYLGAPPKFALLVQEADLPPDASYVVGIVPLLEQFSNAVGLHQIWLAHRPEYHALVERFHQPVADMLLRTDLYLKRQFSSYLGRRFVVLLEPMESRDEINARNYGDDYFVVVSPEHDDLKLNAVRHTYLHYVLDPYAMKHGSSLKRLQPLLATVATAPMDDSFKNDVGLLLTESLIRAIEARTLPGAGKQAEAARETAVETSMKEGFVLSRYFYDALMVFEKGPVGLKDSYPDWIYQIDLGREKKRAQETEFAQAARPDPLHASQPQASSLDLAEQRLASHDASGAAKLAQQALDRKGDDPARALFILARAAADQGDMQGAQSYFQRTLEIAKEPRTVAWSHIYLGRIYDLQEDREAAVAQYQAALAAGDATPDTTTAAQRGMAHAYEPPHASRPQN